MRESIFNTEIKRSIEAIGGFAYKIPDSDFANKNIKGMRFTLEKPFDLVVCWRGNFIAIEGKQIKKWRAFGPKALRPSQVRNLEKVLNCNGKAFVFLNVRIPNETNRLLIFDYSQFKHLNHSIKSEHLKKAKYIDAKVYDKKIFFNLSGFINETRVIKIHILERTKITAKLEKPITLEDLKNG